MERLINRLEKKDPYRIFKEPVTDAVVCLEVMDLFAAKSCVPQHLHVVLTVWLSIPQCWLHQFCFCSKPASDVNVSYRGVSCWLCLMNAPCRHCPCLLMRAEHRHCPCLLLRAEHRELWALCRRPATRR